MKVTAFIGSARKRHTCRTVETFLKNLASNGDVSYEMVYLGEYNLKPCKGCQACFSKGEQFCPLKDDRDLLFEKIRSSDGVIFASPNYSFHVSSIMKIFLDKFGYCFHRPQFFGKTFTSIVVQGVYGGGKIVKYFNFVGKALGFNVVKGVCLNTMDPMKERAVLEEKKRLEKHGKRFYARLMKEKFPSPSILDLMIFNMAKWKIKANLTEEFRDYSFYKENGWFNSEFYYSVKLNFLKRIAGKLIDSLSCRMATGE